MCAANPVCILWDASHIWGLMVWRALCALGLKLSLALRSGYLFVFAAFGLLWGLLRQLGLARGGKSV